VTEHAQAETAADEETSPSAVVWPDPSAWRWPRNITELLNALRMRRGYPPIDRSR